MNSRPVNATIIVPQLPQQTSRWPNRVPASTLSRDHRHDVTGRPTTVFDRLYNNVKGRGTTDRMRIQPEISGYRTASRRQQPLCQTNWTSKLRNDAGFQAPITNGRRICTQPIGGKELHAGTVGRVGRQTTNCDQILISRGISHTAAQPGVKPCNTSRNTTKTEPEVEISKPQNNDETSAVAASDDFAGDVEYSSASRSSRDSTRMSISSFSRDDVMGVRGGRSARTSGVFSRMSTEAQQACIAVKRSAICAAANDEPETNSPAHAHDTTSGLDVQQRATSNRTRPRDWRRHRAKYTTQETAYNVFEPQTRAPVNSASTCRVVAVPQRSGHDSGRALGNFRITSAAYDSRFVEMASTASRRVPNNCETANNNNDDDDGNDAETRAASVVKCLLWLKTQHCHTNY